MSVYYRICAVMLALLAGIVPAMAADAKPPLEALRHQNYNLISTERLDDKVIDGKIWVKVIERLKGDTTSPEKIDVIVQSGDAELIRPGVRYLLYYSDIERANFKVRKEVRNPERRRILHIAGADPAVFLDTPEMRMLLSPGHREIEQNPEYREVVKLGLQSEDPRMVDFWSAEWVIGGRFRNLRPDEVGLLKTVIDDSMQLPAARARLLGMAIESNNNDEDPGFVAGAIAILDGVNPPELAESTGLSELIYASLLVVRKHPDESSVEPLVKWLGSTPPLAENAALALRAINPEYEEEAVRAATNDESIPPQTRKFLADHLRRLELSRERANQGQSN